MKEAKSSAMGWWINPNGHPLPELPDGIWLKTEYLSQIAQSMPALLDEARELVHYITELNRNSSPDGLVDSDLPWKPEKHNEI